MVIITISSCINECGLFFRTNWVNLVLLIPGVFLYTILHEIFHAFAVVLQGGRVTHFNWIPSRISWGHIYFKFPAGKDFSNDFISLAPYIISSVIGAIVCAFGTASVPISHSTSSAIFIWFFIIPVGDLGFALIPYVLFGLRNDLFDVFGYPKPHIRCLLLLGGCFITVLGYFLQRRLYGSLALSVCAYLLMAVLAIILVIAVNYKHFYNKE